MPGKPTSILDSIRSLTSRIACRLFRLRSHTYHTRKAESVHDSFFASLHNSIEHFANYAAINGKLPYGQYEESNIYSEDSDGEGLHTHHLGLYFIKEPANDLVCQFERENLAAMTHDGFNEKLKSHGVHHVHKALCFARIGDEDNAKLHMTLAKDTFEMLKHYLNDPEYDKYIQQINKELITLGIIGFATTL